MIRHLRDIAISSDWERTAMRDSFNYSGFCKSTYSFNDKRERRAESGGKRGIQNNPAWRVPPYLAQTPTTHYFKWSE